MPLSRTLLTAAALAVAAAAPSAAHAAEGFTGITTTGRVAHFQSDSVPGLDSAPVKVTGLAAGERVVGLDRTPAGELLALTSAGKLDSLDADTGKATSKFPAPVTGPVDPNAALTFAVAPDGKSARIITAGRDEVVDLATGAAKPAGGLTFAAGDHHAGAQAEPAFDYLPDGRLIGIDPAQNAIAAQSAAGATTVSTLGGLPIKARSPVRTTVASDRSVWTVMGLTINGKGYQQSRLVHYDPATGKVSGTSGTFLGYKLAALASDGQVPDDTTKPKGSIRGSVLYRHVNHGRSFYGPIGVKSNEPGQVTAELLLGGKTVGFALESRDVAGFYTVDFGPRRGYGAELRRAAAVHRRAVVRMTVHDYAGNKRTYQRVVHLSR
jgi:hypothetical protein